MVYYCDNCRSVFDKAELGFHPLGDFGGEQIWICPVCGAAEMFCRKNAGEIPGGKEQTHDQ